MENQYIKPILSIINFDSEDIIRTSGEFGDDVDPNKGDKQFNYADLP